jgi:hypothetical protein
MHRLQPTHSSKEMDIDGAPLTYQHVIFVEDKIIKRKSQWDNRIMCLLSKCSIDLWLLMRRDFTFLHFVGYIQCQDVTLAVIPQLDF